MDEQLTLTAFAGHKQIATGPLETILPVIKHWHDANGNELLAIFEDQSGRQVDFDMRGTAEEVMARAAESRPRPGPGRPRLGVVSREVSLLPRHWTWLEEQPNGTSAAIRRLVDLARKQQPDRHSVRLAMDAACRFLSAMAGNFAGYEEATRALYAADARRFEALIGGWPEGIRAHVRRITRDAFGPSATDTR